MHEVGRRRRNQPAPPHAIVEALTDFDRPGPRPWLELSDDEHRPQQVSCPDSSTVVWSSIWTKRPDAVIEFDLQPDGGSGTNLCWTLFVGDPEPDAAVIGHLRKRMNQLINASLRYSFGH